MPSEFIVMMVMIMFNVPDEFIVMMVIIMFNVPDEFKVMMVMIMFNMPGQVDHIPVAQSQLVVKLRHEGMDCEGVRSHFNRLPSVAKLCILISMATVAAVLRRRFFLLVLFFCRRGWRLSLAASQCHGQTVGHPSWALKTLKALTRMRPGGSSLVG